MARSHKILIIDDDPDYVNATRHILERHYAVLCAYNGKEGWQRLKEEKPDLIILDVLMENKTQGFVFSRELRKERAFHDIPVIMLTGMRQQTGFFFPKDQSSDPRLLPTDLFMEKPVSPTELLINIENVLQRSDFLHDQPFKKGEAKPPEHKFILIVEPDKGVANEYRTIFRDEGYEVQIVSSVTETVKELKNIKCDCIIVDVDLPDMAGYDAVSVIKTIEPTANIIITAATNTKELEARIRKEDIFYYYIKSFDREELKLAIRNVLTPCEREVHL